MLLSTGMSLLNQTVVGISGLILPVYIIHTYGSTINGLVQSITQFLALISLLDVGVGAVVQSNLFKPLAQNDIQKLSEVIKSAERFYRRIAEIFLGYVVVLAIGYPLINLDRFDFPYTASLLLILSIGNFAQYYFGITYQTLLNADQKAYVPLALQTIAVILNLVVCLFLIQHGVSIHILKLVTVMIYLLRPIGVNLYVKKHYVINKKVELHGEPIKQKWNGLYQHIATVVLSNTDVMILTFFSTLENVSVYTVYYNVIRILKELMESLTNGFLPFVGNMYARKEKETLEKFFIVFEWAIHTCVVLIFTITGIMITPFVSVYTAGITDSNYIHYSFGIVLSIALAVFCIRIPYGTLIKAAGHYKQTQTSAIIEMMINIIISVFAVARFGLIGVAVGTLCAMLYRSVYFGYYSSKYIMKRPYRVFIKCWLIDILSVVCVVVCTRWVNLNVNNYIEWIQAAIKVSLTACVIITVISCIFSRDSVKKMFSFIAGKLRSK